MYVILDETGFDTGRFRGSFRTQPAHLPRKDNTLNVRSGDRVQLIYQDARARYGERDREVEAERAVGFPVFRISRR